MPSDSATSPVRSMSTILQRPGALRKAEAPAIIYISVTELCLSLKQVLCILFLQAGKNFIPDFFRRMTKSRVVRHSAFFMLFYFMGISLRQLTITAYIVGAVHERPGSIKSVFRIRPGAFVGCGLCRRAIRESPLRSYREPC